MKLRKLVEDTFVVVAFAEANCHEMINFNAHSIVQRDTLDVFLKNVGLQNAKVSYGLMGA